MNVSMFPQMTNPKRNDGLNEIKSIHLKYALGNKRRICKGDSYSPNGKNERKDALSSSQSTSLTVTDDDDRSTSTCCSLSSSPMTNISSSSRRISLLPILSSSSNCRNYPQTQLERKVSFSNLEIREYPITLGDNPGGTMGPPISLDYQKGETQMVMLEDYENKRPPRRSLSELHITGDIRTLRLRQEHHVSGSEIDKAIMEAMFIRSQRTRSIEYKSFFTKLKMCIKF